MGLRDIFRNAARTAINAMGNVPETCTYHELAYDAQGQATGGDATTIVGLKAIREALSIDKVDGQAVLATDRLYLVAALDMGDVIPTEDDLLEFAVGAVWTIKRVETDAAGATHSLQVRR